MISELENALEFDNSLDNKNPNNNNNLNFNLKLNEEEFDDLNFLDELKQS